MRAFVLLNDTTFNLLSVHINDNLTEEIEDFFANVSNIIYNIYIFINGINLL